MIDETKLKEWERSAKQFKEVVLSEMEKHLFPGDEIHAERCISLIKAYRESEAQRNTESLNSDMRAEQRDKAELRNERLEAQLKVTKELIQKKDEAFKSIRKTKLTYIEECPQTAGIEIAEKCADALALKLEEPKRD